MNKREILELFIKSNGNCIEADIDCDLCKEILVCCDDPVDLLSHAKLELSKLDRLEKNKTQDLPGAKQLWDLAKEDEVEQPKSKYTQEEIEFLDKCVIASIVHKYIPGAMYPLAKLMLEERRKALK
jgi:hypothetical protein